MKRPITNSSIEIKYNIEDIKETNFLIQTQLNDALDTYKEVKGERQKNLIKKIILETDNEITTSNGFLIFYQLCKCKLFKAKDEELNEYLSKKFAAYNNVDIKKWFEISGVPILLNTSFNDREPIVETPENAINCFLGTNIDYLYFRDYNILVKRL